MDIFFKRRHTNGQKVRERLTDEWIKCGIYMYKMKHYSVTKKKNLVICDNKNRPWEREFYAKWNKSDRGQMSYICDKFTYMWNLKANQISIIETHTHLSPCSLQHYPQ